MRKNLREGYEEDIQEIVDLMNEHDYSDAEIATAICAYEEYDITVDEIREMVDNDEISETSEYTYNDGTFVTLGTMEFIVYENATEAYNGAKEWFEGLVDEIGITQAVPDYVWEDYLDEDSCEEFFRDDYRSYCEDIVNESDDTYGNRLVSECVDAGIIDDYDFEEDEDGELDYSQCTVDEDELIEKYVDYMVDRIDNFGEELKFAFGEDGLTGLIDNGAIEFDMEGLTERYIDDYGVGGCLSGYDGQENVIDYDNWEYYIYRHN